MLLEITHRKHSHAASTDDFTIFHQNLPQGPNSRMLPRTIVETFHFQDIPFQEFSASLSQNMFSLDNQTKDLLLNVHGTLHPIVLVEWW
jgi:hypothetical protein